jgi:uncharacterized protein
MSYYRSAHPSEVALLQGVNSCLRSRDFWTRHFVPHLHSFVIRPRYDGVVQVVVLWDVHNVEHVARHGVTPNEVEEVVRTDKARWFTDDTVRLGRLVVLGPTTTGRLLVVVLDRPAPSGVAYCVTARPMSPRERQDYERASE